MKLLQYFSPQVKIFPPLHRIVLHVFLYDGENLLAKHFERFLAETWHTQQFLAADGEFVGDTDERLLGEHAIVAPQTNESVLSYEQGYALDKRFGNRYRHSNSPHRNAQLA